RMDAAQGSLFGRTYREPTAATAGGTSPRFSRHWWEETFGVPPTGGPTLVLPLDPSAAPSGALSTLNISEWPNDAAACSLSTVLEASDPGRFLLSPQSCRCILRSAERRGSALPEPLREALVAAARET